MSGHLIKYGWQRESHIPKCGTFAKRSVQGLGLFHKPRKETGTDRGQLIVEIEGRMMQPGAGACAQKQIGAGARFQHIGEIL
jgi:hypothetical protein